MLFDWEGRSIYYADEGQGPPLVFLHGLGGNSDNWIGQRRAFARNHRVLTLDLPGHGHSAGHDVPFSRYWEVLDALLSAVKVTRAAVCGLSKGARVALSLAAHRPGSISTITVINAFVHLNARDQAERMALYDILLEPNGVIRWATQLLDKMGVVDRPAIVRGFLKAASTINPVHIHGLFRQLIEFDQRSEISSVGHPVLLIRGAHDGFVPGYCAQELTRLLVGSETVHMADCGHLPYLEAPDDFNAILSAFLKTQ